MMTEKNRNLFISIIILASLWLLITLSLALFNSVYAVFFIYYLGYGIILPVMDRIVFKKEKLKQLSDYIGATPLPGKKALITGAVSFAFVFSGILVFFALLKDTILDSGKIISALAAWGVTKGNIAPVFIVMVIFNGAVEELFWRGYIHRRFEIMENRILANAVPVFFFAAQHSFIILNFTHEVLPFIVLMLGIGLGGVIFALLREKTNNVLASVMCHVGATAGYMSAFYLFVLK